MPHIPNKPKIKVGKISQIGIVTKNVDNAVKRYWETLGIGPWKIHRYEPPNLRDTKLRGVPAKYSMKIALAKVGSIELELIEPLKGPNLYEEFLAKRGEGFHHIAKYQKGDLKKELDAFEAMGIKVLMSGKCKGVEFYYLDTEPILGIIYELVRIGKGGVIPPVAVYPPAELR
ncbi:MAG: VOC family protein [Candidatus Hadarchaeum sp.]|uniref:VOC family protein n=1 Tax=Candidatus Hadarchaeum sp. TaxID=2883567 RepID=UPI00316BB5AA